MPADYKINLAKDLTSTLEKRTRFYNGMLIYIALVSVSLIGVAYFSSMNVHDYIKNRQEHIQRLRTVTALHGLEESAFKNPQKMYVELEEYSKHITMLKKALGQQVQLLPVTHNLFLELPDGVALQSFSADRQKIVFGLEMPPPSDESGDLVRDLRESWEKNSELMRRVSSIRAVTGERRTKGTESMFFVEFECILNK